jgi:hypothetical protein
MAAYSVQWQDDGERWIGNAEDELYRQVILLSRLTTWCAEVITINWRAVLSAGQTSWWSTSLLVFCAQRAWWIANLLISLTGSMVKSKPTDISNTQHGEVKAYWHSSHREHGEVETYWNPSQTAWWNESSSRREHDGVKTYWHSSHIAWWSANLLTFLTRRAWWNA